MNATKRARRSDSLYYDTQVTNRRALCDMIANLESDLTESKAENAKLRELVGERQRDAVEVVRCRDCKHGHITINGKSCKWCDLIATHDPDGCEPYTYNGYDPEPYFDADFFCAWGKRKESE